MNTILLAILVMGVLGAIFGALLAYASKVFHVEVDPKQPLCRFATFPPQCGGIYPSGERLLREN